MKRSMKLGVLAGGLAASAIVLASPAHADGPDTTTAQAWDWTQINFSSSACAMPENKPTKLPATCPVPFVTYTRHYISHALGDEPVFNRADDTLRNSWVCEDGPDSGQYYGDIVWREGVYGGIWEKIAYQMHGTFMINGAYRYNPWMIGYVQDFQNSITPAARTTYLFEEF